MVHSDLWNGPCIYQSHGCRLQARYFLQLNLIRLLYSDHQSLQTVYRLVSRMFSVLQGRGRITYRLEATKKVTSLAKVTSGISACIDILTCRTSRRAVVGAVATVLSKGEEPCWCILKWYFVLFWLFISASYLLLFGLFEGRTRIPADFVLLWSSTK